MRKVKLVIQRDCVCVEWERRAYIYRFGVWLSWWYGRGLWYFDPHKLKQYRVWRFQLGWRAKQ
jgi:hypothetical protein